jgi:hypothetical protein
MTVPSVRPRVVSKNGFHLFVMNKNTAYCGLNCRECNAYIATMNDDDELRTSVAKKWDSPDYLVSKEDINCIGCRIEPGAHFKWCGSCAVRKCASERGVETCAHCDDYVCSTLKEWLTMAGDEARERLEKIHAAL